MIITLPHGAQVNANKYDLRDKMNALDVNKRYMPTSREFGLIMIANRIKRSAALKRARQFARSLKTFKRQ